MDSNIWSDFWKSLPELRDKTAAAANRSGISADAAILLAVIYEFPGLKLPVDNGLFYELREKGFITYNAYYNVTRKGAIIAKSFSELIKSVL